MWGNTSLKPSNPVRDWHHLGSGSTGVKLATGHVYEGNHVSHGNSANELNIWHSVNIGSWNIRGLLATGKPTIAEKEIRTPLYQEIITVHF